MKELKGHYKGFHYDISFIGNAEHTVCVCAIRSGEHIVDIRSERFLALPAGLAGELAIRQRIHDHIDSLV